MRALLLGLAFLATLMGGCKKAKTASAAPVDLGTGARESSNNTEFVQGGGAVQNIRKAAERTEVLAEMQQLGPIIMAWADSNGKMPTVQEIKDELRTVQKILAHINSGNIILTGTKNRNGLWAYQVDADKYGGIVLVGGSARRERDAEDVKKLMNQ